ncbi:polyphenol oxidase family protein [Paenarthrobacter sp. PH39-S1]|nr:polyphenol oxidase family protein [Paenarthrobacter sp. PH39-S1]MDJ0356938.1 polyphenol oxidase family protein [Paenarthrobacter sp. PH39-S1]
MFWWNHEVSPGIRVGFTDTGAGNLAFHVGGDADGVRRNRARLQLELGPGAGPLRFMNQVHGCAVVQVSAVDAGPTADAMVSTDASLAVLVADCVPVVLLGESAAGRPVLAVSHAGRPGVASQVVPKTVEAMRSRGAVRIRAWLGPSVCGACYEVPARLRDEVAAVEPSTFATTSWGTPALDLPAGVLSQLSAAGVEVAGMESVGAGRETPRAGVKIAGVEAAGGNTRRLGACTMEQPGLFSHRRDAAHNRPQGRFAGVIYVTE